jgi:cephalosporin hydroxylase
VIEVLQVESEFSQLRDLYDDVAPAAVLEIGSYQGGTLKEWLTLGDPLRVVAVDLHHVNPDAYQGWRQEHTFLQVVTGDSKSPHVRAQIEEFAPYDWAFIDGDHAAEGVVNDAAFVLPLMRLGGHLAFHDLVGGDDCPDYAPGRVVDELENQGYEVQRFIEPGPSLVAHGIGVVRIPD